METTSIILTLMLVGMAVGTIAWLATLHHRERNAPRVEKERRQEPNESQPATTDAVSQHPQESLQRVADTPLIQGILPPSREHRDGASPKVQLKNAHSDTSLVPVQDAVAEPTQAVALTCEPPQKESHEPIASDESANLATSETPPEMSPQEEPPMEAQKAARVVMEATQKRESEPAQPKEARPCRERAPVRPEDRGGRSRETEPKSESGGETKRRTRASKPEIVCWKREREWILAVELPDDFPEKENVKVVQDGKPLENDEAENGCWRLAQLHGEVVVRVTDADNGRVFRLPLGDDGCLIFKLSGDDRGRHVKRPTSGSCLAVVPQDWERDEALAGPPSIAPEDVCLASYRAHFFELPSKLAFRDANNQSVELASGGPLFQLVGEQIHDASENLGPLFAGEPPRIQVGGGTWDNVRTIILGEEGSGKGRWRTQFEPKAGETQQQMPPELAKRKAGWYFLRFYDEKDELIDSLDFRFCAGLRKVTTSASKPFPSATGHGVTTVEFEHENGWRVIASSPSQNGVTIEQKNNRTILKIPPQPDCDLTRWKISDFAGHNVEATVLLERVWWAVSKADCLPQQWTDQQLVLSRQDLTATSAKALWLRLPKQRWTEFVRLGFSQAAARTYHVPNTKNTVAVPLRDFWDVPDVQTIGEFPLHLWVSHDLTIHTTSPGRLFVRAGCRCCDFSANTEAEVLTHFRANHLRDLFRPLTYNEYREYSDIPSLPAAIYQCGYCSHYVRSDDAINPSSAIYHHVKQCPEARRQAGEGRPVYVSFRVITDVEEIRNNVISSLPSMRMCVKCEEAVFKNYTDEELMEHLTEEHESCLVELR
jgi:hypothetical protein